MSQRISDDPPTILDDDDEYNDPCNGDCDTCDPPPMSYEDQLAIVAKTAYGQYRDCNELTEKTFNCVLRVAFELGRAAANEEAKTPT